MGNILRGAFWIGLYLALVTTPLFFLLLGPTPPGSGFWTDLSLALGFAGTAMMAVMFVLTARFHRATAPFGIDLIYYFHRLTSLAAFIFILAHPFLLMAEEPALLSFLHPRFIPWHLTSGVLSFLLLATLMATSLWRKPLGIHYDSWRLGHMVLAVAALALAVAHIAGTGHFSAIPWKSGLWMAIALSCLAVVAYVRLIRPLQMLRRPYRVHQVIAERGSTWTLVLKPRGHGGFRFLPGQFAWLTLWSSPFAMKEHPFSISSGAQTTGELHFTIKELGDFTRRVKTVEPGAIAYVDGPYGSFSVDRSRAPGFVFVAGGVGIAPIMSMLRTLADRGDGRPLLLFYAYHTWERLTFREELENLTDRIDLKIVYVLSEPPGGWEGESGFLREEIFARHLPADKMPRECYVCGPTPMIEVAERALSHQGVPLGRIHSEIFDLV